MAPTSEERREVAERLRTDVSEEECIDYAVFRIIKDVLGVNGAWDAKAASILADLIDPQERTCHVLNPHRPNGCEGLGVFGECSECGGEIETVDEHDRAQNPWKRADAFCKGCGARVVDE